MTTNHMIELNRKHGRCFVAPNQLPLIIESKTESGNVCSLYISGIMGDSGTSEVMIQESADDVIEKLKLPLAPRLALQCHSAMRDLAGCATTQQVTPLMLAELTDAVEALEASFPWLKRNPPFTP